MAGFLLDRTGGANEEPGRNPEFGVPARPMRPHHHWVIVTGAYPPLSLRFESLKLNWNF